MSASRTPLSAPLIGFGQVRHTRLRPRHHAFAYPTCFLMLPMRSLRHQHGLLAVNRRGAISFYDVDHGDGRSAAQGGALAWLDELLRAEGITDADGEAWLHCYPRVWGYTFKPVSFWYCHRADGRLRAIVVEVNNTFGERHCYLLDAPQYGVEQQARKVFHVSPFCEVNGGYRFRFMRTNPSVGAGAADAGRTVVRIDHDDDSGPLIQTSVSGTLHAVTASTLRQALWGYPAMTLAIIARIHWHALRLWLKRVRFHRKPEAPAAAVTRSFP
ncbi:DUF1365 domain-containing protein [Paracidovorax sp. MALMAid1276]|uniref:DUF1365 domain-containing protein n=1 Tax=Paracidovorax sp. MALMAid1276 TaxID=3411631 RepID=UPI003B9AA98E